MLRGIVKILILAVILSGCTRMNCSSFSGEDLPEVPVAGSLVADELKQICDDEKCYNLNIWLNELNFFKQEYLIYKHYNN